MTLSYEQSEKIVDTFKKAAYDRQNFLVSQTDKGSPEAKY